MPSQTRTRCVALSILGLAILGVAAAGGMAAANATESAAAVTASSRRAGHASSEFSSQARTSKRAPRRVRIYGGTREPGPNSVRICNAHYEQEHRPSGTVIVPKMRCYWSR